MRYSSSSCRFFALPLIALCLLCTNGRQDDDDGSEQDQADLDKLNAAATKIQSAYKGYKVRRDLQFERAFAADQPVDAQVHFKSTTLIFVSKSVLVTFFRYG